MSSAFIILPLQSAGWKEELNEEEEEEEGEKLDDSGKLVFRLDELYGSVPSLPSIIEPKINTVRRQRSLREVRMHE